MLDGFLLTPLREGRLIVNDFCSFRAHDFYSRPCVRGDLGEINTGFFRQVAHFYSRPCVRGDRIPHNLCHSKEISTHAPA